MTPLSRASAAALISLSIAGCHAAMSNPTTPPSDAPKPGYSNSSEFWPFEFRAHYFGVATYSTYDCKILYNGGIFSMDDERVLQIASSSVGSYPDNLHASAGPYRNFPPPIIVTWRSKPYFVRRLTEEELATANSLGEGDMKDFAPVETRVGGPGADGAPGLVGSNGDKGEWVVVSANWPLCVSRIDPESVKPETAFSSPRGEQAWLKKYDDNFWIFPNWKLDISSKKEILEQAGYCLFVHR